MDNLSLVLYICFFVPMLLSLFVLEKKARLIVGYIIVGTTVCLFVSEVNGILYNMIDRSLLYYCTTISPATEELVKALPVLYLAIFFTDNRRTLIQISFAVGLGFAIMENCIILVQNIDSITITWAVIRGIGAGLMHSVCTMAVGIGISFVKKKRKLFYCGTVALLMMAITYHAIYNTIVMSDYKYFGFILPLATYIPILIVLTRDKKRARQ